MLSWITDFSSSPRGKWIVIALWAVFAGVIIPLSPTLADVTDNSSANFLPEGAETTRVQELVEERFPSSTTPAIVVFLSEDGLSDDERSIADDLGQWALSEDAPEGIDPSQVVSIYTAPQAAEGLVSEDGTTMTMVIGIGGDPNGDDFLEAVEAIREQVADPPPGVDIAVRGPGGLILDLISVFETIDVFLMLITAGLVLVLLIVIYRSPVIALVPLISVGWVFALTGAVAAASAQQFDLLVNGQAQGIATVLLFGAGTDYCLFIASRFREELKRIEDKHEAMRVTMRAVGEAIASSAGTVLVATFILSFAVLRSTAALGPLLTIAIGLMLIAGLTLVPAIVTVLGRFAFWPLRPKFGTSPSKDARHEVGGGLWGTAARLVTGRPITFLVASVAVFAIFSLGLFQYRVTYDSISSLPVGAES
ncbi:MAG: MMPL family transporter [Chloroflexota bacterium]|nr:MMPL family transporter [Chloroflexota bacterium]